MVNGMTIASVDCKSKIQLIQDIPYFTLRIDGLVQERRNSSVLAMELHLSCSNPSNYELWVVSHECLWIFFSKINF